MLPGNYAVETFFMISGFYMSLVLSGKYSGPGTAWTFYSNRYVRLYPVYFLVLIASWLWFLFCWQWKGVVPANSWLAYYEQMDTAPKAALVFSNWTMLGLDIPSLFHFSPGQGFMAFHYYGTENAPDGSKWAGEFRTISQAWSVGLEIWFYCLAPWLSRLSSRWLVIVGTLSAGLKIGMEQAGLLTYFFFPAQLGYFLAGMLAQRFWKQHRTSLEEFRHGWCFMVLVIAVTALFPLIPVPGLRWFYYATVALSLPIIFEQSRKWAWDRWVGNLSYPVYMVHMLALSVISAVCKGEHNVYYVLGLTIAISVALLHLVEEPLDKWRQGRAPSTKAS